NQMSSCLATDRLASSTPYVIFLAVKAILCYVALCLLILHLKIHGVRWLAHSNSMIVFAAYLGCNVTVAAAYGFVYSIDSLRLWLGGPCALIDFRLIFLLRGVGSIAIRTQIIYAFVLSLERFYSSLFPIEFECCKCVALSVAAVVVSLFISTTIIVGVFVPLADFSSLVPTTNLIQGKTGDGYQTMIYFEIGMEVAAIVMFHLG
ncbi:hypothetical protein PENTCL1PPCAC_4745, partial [Pristionchus entomophagus]